MDSQSKLVQETAKSFGFEWSEYNKILENYEEDFLGYMWPINKEFFKGKRVLDVGCGIGSGLTFSNKYGAKVVVGIDISDAIYVAKKHTSNLENVHVIKCDIRYIPLKLDTFDYLYSLGVLHHLPNPKEGFMAISKRLKRGTYFSIWMYGKEGRWIRLNIIEKVRYKITKHIPHRILNYICYASLPAYILGVIYKKFGLNNKRLPFYRYKGESYYRVRVAMFDLLSAPVHHHFTGEELKMWFDEARYSNIKFRHGVKTAPKSWVFTGKKNGGGVEMKNC